MTWPQYFGALAIVAGLIWFGFYIADNIRRLCRDVMVCDLLEDGTPVGVGSVLADSSLGVDGNDDRLGADACTCDPRYTANVSDARCPQHGVLAFLRAGPFDQDAA